MGLGSLSQVLVTLALLGQTSATAATATPQLVTARQAFFAIPFRVDRADDPARQPAKVQLLVSTDRGAHWQLYGKALPAQKHFLFRAGADGEYWFAIRTIDRQGRVHPETIAAPGLRVLVDTSGQQQTPPNNSNSNSSNSNSSNMSNSRGLTAPGPVNHANPPTDDAGPATTNESNGSVAIAINAPIGKNFGTEETTPGLPPGERPRMVNSRRFELEYDVVSVGPSGIGKVELWGTRDGGRTWRSFTTSNNGRTPLLVNVEEAGIYGFHVTVTNGAGIGGKPPTNGDLPDLWVGVDLTRPTARIVSAQQGVESEAGQLILSWQADDKMLAARPISLSFRQTRSGPWLPIASGLENTGRYAWPIDHRTPPRLYLRLEVRDEAGNVGVHKTSEPVAIDQSRPRIRVREVRPVGQTSSRPVRRS